MRKRSDMWVKLAKRGRFDMETKARIGQKDYHAISAPKIDRALMTAPLSVGNCVSATLGLSILTDDEINAKSPVTILGRITDGYYYSEWLEFGTFYINLRDTSFEGLVTISCYDALLKANQKMVEDDDSSTSWPRPMKDVVKEIAYRIGVRIDPRTLIKVGESYVVPFPKGLTMMQVLGYIGGCHGGNWIVTEENALRLVPLVTCPDTTYHIISHDYEDIITGDGHRLVYREQTEFNPVLPPQGGEPPESMIKQSYYITDDKGQRFVTPEGHYLIWAEDGELTPVDGLINVPAVIGNVTTGTKVSITGVTMTDNNSHVYTSGNDTGWMLKIESNPYACQSICDDIYAAYAGLVYEPYTASKTIYDPATELGDQVIIGEKVHSVLYASTLSLDIAFRADIKAPNDEKMSEEYPYLSEFKKLLQTTEQLNKQISDTADNLGQKIEDAGGDTTKLNDALKAEVKRAADAEKELNTRIGSESTRAKGVEDSLGIRIKTIEDINLGGISGDVSGLQQTVSQHTTDINANKGAISTLTTTVSGHTTSISTINQAIEKLEQDIAGLSGSGETIATIQQDIQTIKTNIESLQAAIVTINSRLDALENNPTT